MNIVLYESGESRLALASAPKTASLQAMLAEERAAEAGAAEVASRKAVAALGRSEEDARRILTKQKGETMIRAAGMTYFIARVPSLDDRPSGSRRLAFTQGATPCAPHTTARLTAATPHH